VKFLTPDECRAWCQGWIPFSDHGVPERPRTDRHHVIGDIPPGYAALTSFCQSLDVALQPRRDCLMWVTDFHIFQENRHLYYALRRFHGDNRLLEDAPGHLFLDYEAPALVSFLQVAILNGWDAHLLPSEGYARAFVSHDEFVEYSTDEDNVALVETLRAKLAKPKPAASA